MPEVVPALESQSAGDGPELEQLVVAHFRFIWRLLRRLGLPSSDADDAAQEVFLIASGKLSLIRPGRERAFLYGCALHLTAKWRRNAARQRRDPSLDDSSRVAGSSDTADDLVERARARALLDSILGELPEPLRSVFVLYEIEQLSTHEIADLLGLPRGTVASRLRRARAEFEKRAQRAAARSSRPQGQRMAKEERDDV